MEHISSNELIDRLDKFMGCPEYDPHDDPIPNSKGMFKAHDLKLVSAIGIGESGTIWAVRHHSPAFLQYLEKQELTIGKKITIADVIEFDHSVILQMGEKQLQISREVANNLLIAI